VKVLITLGLGLLGTMVSWKKGIVVAVAKRIYREQLTPPAGRRRIAWRFAPCPTLQLKMVDGSERGPDERKCKTH
jgi:hypothetical protein